MPRSLLIHLALVASTTVPIALASPAIAMSTTGPAVGGIGELAIRSIFNQPLPSNAYIHFNDLEWAWAAPVNNATWPLPLDFSVQGPLGWRLPTAAEMLLAPGGSNFLFAGANVPFNGTDPVSGSQFQFTGPNYDAAKSAGACAATYFQNTFAHCDFDNAPDQVLNPVPWAGQPNDFDFSDQLVVRESRKNTVPGPLPVLGIGAAFGYSRKLRKRIKTSKSPAVMSAID